MPDTALLVFAKLPEPGRVMTRLCPPLTPQGAAAVQRGSIRLLCERAFRAWPVSPTLMITPDDAEDQFRAFAGPLIRLVGQGDGDLGQRITRAANAALADGARQALIIGGDSPTIPQRLIDDAIAARSSDAVIGPCDDGGFYLIGLTRTEPGMLGDIDWSTDRAAQQTVDRLTGHRLTVTTLDPWYDIDRPADLERCLAELRAANEPDAFELLKTIEDALAANKPQKAKKRA